MGTNAGRSGARWRRIKEQVRQTETHCYRCGQRIDWSIPYRDEHGNVNKMSGTAEHTHPLSTHRHLAEDLGNIRASHLDCNQSAGNRAPLPGLGTRSRNW